MARIRAPWLFLLALHCGGDPETTLPEVVYGGAASDEALERVWPKIATAEVSDTKAARITAPMNGATISNAAAPQLTWAFPGQGLAPAHLPPVTGDVFLVEFTIPGDNKDPLRLFTTEMSWTPDPDSWARMKAATGAITTKIYNAYLNNNVLEEGPFTRQESVGFTIGSM